LARYSVWAGNVEREDVERALGRPVVFVLPYDRNALVAMNLGKPLVIQRPTQPYAVAVRSIAGAVLGEVATTMVPKRRGLFARLTSGIHRSPRSGDRDAVTTGNADRSPSSAKGDSGVTVVFGEGNRETGSR
jgi:hypothetical protein